MTSKNTTTITNILWERFFDTFIKASILATYFFHKEKNVSLSEAIEEYRLLSNRYNIIALPEVEVPKKYFAEYAEKYNSQISKISEISNPDIADLITLDGICEAYRFVIETYADKNAVQAELDLNRERLKGALDRPEYQPSGGPRIHMDAYIQTLQEILQIFEDAEKE
jgi:hypothetical protein